jgi:DNA-directed RNA polymerase subunit RPC12/RpoP
MKLKCLTCSDVYSVRASALTNPQSDKQATCPNCRDSDTRVVFDEITFGSQFERDCYKLLRHLKPKLQQLYKDEFNTNRLWTCDFVVGDCWIEVSNYTKYSQGYDSYLANIEAKEVVVTNSGKRFFYLTSLREVQDFINNI